MKYSSNLFLRPFNRDCACTLKAFVLLLLRPHLALVHPFRVVSKLVSHRPLVEYSFHAVDAHLLGCLVIASGLLPGTAVLSSLSSVDASRGFLSLLEWNEGTWLNHLHVTVVDVPCC